MKKLGLAAMFVGAFGLVACGGGSGGDADAGDISFTDARDNTPDAGIVAPCNPVANTGCATNEKCTYVVDSQDPFLGHTDCVADGTVDAGGACTFTAGVDDCVGGTWCIGSVCTEICSTAPDSCGQNSACVPLRIDDHLVFSDAEGTGLCSPTCDPLDQDLDQSGGDGTCPLGEGCYLSLFSGSSTCAAPFVQGTQGDDCTALNGCSIGYGCALNNDPQNPTGLVCAFYCDADNAGGPTCATEGPGPSYFCHAIRNLYNNVSQDIPLNVGICIDCSTYPGPDCPMP